MYLLYGIPNQGIKDLEKTGFPLEVSILSELDKRDWMVYPGALYKDPETSTSREIDIHAVKVDFSYYPFPKIEKGVYAIEPFATNGSGKIHNGNSSGIYQLIEYRNTRSENARNVLEFIEKEYKTLPFCSRWLVKKFGTKVFFALRELEQNEILYQFPQLVEVAGSKVSQAEDTILVDKEGKVVTSE